MDNTLKYRGYQAEIKYSIPDKCLYGKIADISDLVTFEGNETNIVNEFHNAVEDYLIFCEENHKEPAQPVCKTIMLWEDDFRNKRDWKAICKVLQVPENTVEMEIHISHVLPFIYRHTHGYTKKSEKDLIGK